LIDTICIFEGVHHKDLFPLVHIRPTFDLRCGISNLRDKIVRHYPNVTINLHCRNYLAEHIKQRNPKLIINDLHSDGCLFIDGRVVADSDFGSKIPLQGEDKIYVKGKTIIAARITGEKLEKFKHHLMDTIPASAFDGLEKEEVDVNYVHYPWELIQNNGNEIVEDYKFLTKDLSEMINSPISAGVNIVNENNIYIGKGVDINPGVVLDASDGPIYIADSVRIMANACLRGPLYIGENSIVKMGAKIYENTSIGNVCKVGGEIEDSIIHSYSNKQHDGFLGHSYLGAWVNLGADTNSSDLKSNYGNIKVVINDEIVDSKSQFVGSIIGDHSKTSINTMLNTGTVIGISCNVYGSGFPPKYMPSFSWGGSEGVTTYNLDKCLEVAERVMKRRDIEISDDAKRLISKVFEMTREERHGRGMPY
jgi:UDP-N-acetylglucosamine diphosphorylase/glucosamine-1-phosphate N-acetyltransferase